MVTAIVLGVLGVGTAAAFVLLLVLARRRSGALTRRRRSTADAAGVERLAVGAELVYDDQRWDVRGVQHVTPDDGPAWSAWHLDDRGQSGWMATAPGLDHVLFAVRAERPETLDGAAERLRWRDHEWVRIEHGVHPARAAGERRVPRGPLVPVPDGPVERSVLTREDLRTRRLVLERGADGGPWNAWIGGTVPVQMVDVWPPAEPSDGESSDGVRTDAVPPDAVPPNSGPPDAEPPAPRGAQPS